MATPGRTHISWQTQNGQVHELINYIGFLEAKVQYLQQHHEHCDMFGFVPAPERGLDRNPPAPYLPPDVIVAAEPQNPEFSPILPLPVSITPVKPPEPNPRWKRIVDQMTKGWDTPQAWNCKREAIGLNSVPMNKYALMVILGMKKDLPENLRPSNLLDQCAQQHSNPKEALIYSARQYAIDTKSSETNVGLVVQIHVFRELVFASLCVVMEQQGLPIDTINDLMRICMSSSGPANLYRLRRGALWVNRVIGGMMKKGWGHGATEFFLLAGRPVSQYGLLWEACMHSFPYLSEQLAKIHANVEVPVDEEGWIPFFIPLIIKGLVGDSLSLPQICTALDYEEEFLSKLPLGSS